MSIEFALIEFAETTFLLNFLLHFHNKFLNVMTSLSLLNNTSKKQHTLIIFTITTHNTVLREFDMNIVYGPHTGMMRMERWECAMKLRSKSQQEIESLLKSGKVKKTSLLDTHV
jgi:hypothetical protein